MLIQKQDNKLILMEVTETIFNFSQETQNTNVLQMCFKTF